MNQNYYELRHVIKSNEKSFNFYFENINEQKTLEDNIFEYDKIVLLGNPGIGKSTELKNLFDVLWSKIDSNGLVPFSINLKNFRPVNNFEDLLAYKNWKDLSRVIFILDGLDEIAEIEDFLSAFEIFMNQYKLANFKYVISCRTNIFEKYLVNIADFETFYLEDLTYEQSSSILFQKFAIKVEDLDLSGKHRQYLKTPFFLNLFAEYFISEKKLPDSDAKMWEIYVNKHMELQKIKVQKRRVVNIPKEIKELKKIAFLNEFQHKNFITSVELNDAIGNSYLELIENPFFINLENEQEKFGFEHRQLQEYFVAKTLSEKKFDEILSIIKIDNLDKLHPTLFNSISFLLNLITDQDTTNRLIDWIEKYQIELLISADSDRIAEELKIRAFQKYFEEVCISKTYWITTDRIFSLNEVAKFGDCEINFDYLINIITNKEIQFRARISALNIISFFRKISNDKLIWFKSFLIENLKSIDNSKQLKSAMLQCLSVMKICYTDKKYLDEVLKIFENETDKKINAELLFIINEFDDIDEYSNFIKEEFLRVNNIKPRIDQDNVIRSNSYTLNQLILKIKSPDIFIDFAKYYFDSDKSIDIYASDENELIEKCIEFDRLDDNFITKLFKDFTVQKPHFYFDRKVRELLSKSSVVSIEKFFKYLLCNFEFKDVSYVLSYLVDNKTIYLVIEKLRGSKDFDHKEIEYFRNSMANNQKRDTARIFNDEMIKNGFVFREELYSDEEIEVIKKRYESKPQINFDILFKREDLINELREIFNNNEGEIDQEKYYEINLDWYNNNGHGNLIDTSLEILRSLVYDLKRPISIKDVEQLFEDKDFVFYEMKNDLQKDEKTNKIQIHDSQREVIRVWIEEKINEINFNQIVLIKEDGYILLSDYSKWEIVVYLSRRMDFNLPKDFMLNSLVIPEIRSYDEDKTWFNYFRERINDKNSFNDKVEENIKNIDLAEFVLDQHVNYALEESLKAVFPIIRAYLLSESRERNFKKKLFKFYKIENDKKLLKECAENVYSFNAWEAISILLEEGEEKEFCIEKSISYLENIENDNQKYFVSNSLNVLFQLNSVKAVEYYYKFLNLDLYAYTYANYFSNYDVIKDYEILECLFDQIYLDAEFDRILSNASNFLNQYVYNLSREDTSFQKVQNILGNIKKRLLNESNDHGIFHINLLIDHSNNSYINSKSKPLSFKEALRKVNEILN